MQRSIFAGILSALLLAGCAAQTTPGTALPAGAPALPAAGASHAQLSDNTLIYATNTGQLRYWHIDKTGGRKSYLLTTIPDDSQPSGMAANGDTVAVAIQNPPGIILYDASTGKQTTLPIKVGYPGDIAYDKQGDILVLSAGSVRVYAGPNLKPKQIACSLFHNPWYVASDRKGDIFVSQTAGSNSEVIELPKDKSGYETQKCSQLPLQVSGTPAGLQVDPKSDALVVFHNPDECAGGNEGVMDIYPRPYGKGTVTTKNLNGNCAFALRFGPDDSQVFFLDGSPTLPRNGGRTNYGLHVSQREYPAGTGHTEYRDPALYMGVATIPNKLPN